MPINLHISMNCDKKGEVTNQNEDCIQYGTVPIGSWSQSFLFA